MTATPCASHACHADGRARCPTCGDCCTKIVDLSASFGGKPVLEHVNLHMHCGELTAVIGPNGAGKSTLLRAVVGEVPHSGRVEFTPHGNRPPGSMRIGYVPQKPEFDTTTPVSVTDLFAGTLARRPVWTGHSHALRRETAHRLAQVQAGHLADRRIGALSGGELQRVLLALALTPVPDLLLLDEPVSGVDPAGIGMFYRMVSHLRAEHDLSVLLVSHDVGVAARFADRMIFLNRTVLAEGTPAQVLAHEAVRATFGTILPEVSGAILDHGHTPHQHHTVQGLSR